MRVYAILGHLPAYGEPRSSRAIGLGLGVHFAVTGLTAPLFLIPPIWVLPIAAFYCTRSRDEPRAFLCYTLLFVAGYALIGLHQIYDPWRLVEWLLD